MIGLVSNMEKQELKEVGRQSLTNKWKEEGSESVVKQCGIAPCGGVFQGRRPKASVEIWEHFALESGGLCRAQGVWVFFAFPLL